MNEHTTPRTQIICSRCRKELQSDKEMRFHSQCVRKVQFAGVVTEPDGAVDSIITSGEGDQS